MREPLRALLLAAPGSGRLTGPEVLSGGATHPVCGDEVEVDLRVADERVRDYRWRASGCPATTATAAAAIWTASPIANTRAAMWPPARIA